MTDNRATLIALASRVEKLTGPDRETDAEIQVRLFEKPDYNFPEPVLNRKPYDWQEAAGRFRWDGYNGHHAWPAYTASIDAAMTLVPEGWNWSLDLRGNRYGAVLNGTPFARTASVVDGSATPALALTAACLRAQAETLP